ncbi:hypothetical protein K2173_010536 [Erythroxylum novogranatense]|uniref:Uncharacterized protein n=1 Tax=Erythroxylum novogranatense TaxID=1862640 RepID=A0AAV8TGD3_9ROSI|nr:hypothetical protein K2173_010536 [Erythroxylum novogranatense]
MSVGAIKTCRNLFILLLLLLGVSTSYLSTVGAEDPYKFFDWTITYGDIYPLGVRQKGILINGQFPGPNIDAVTNDNLIINVRNHLHEPFLLTWNGIQQRKNSYVDGVYGTTCPIPPGQNYTYKLHVKDQIGTFYYSPSLAFHKAAGAFGGIKILSRSLIPVPFPNPADDIHILIGDWYRASYKELRAKLDRGHKLPSPHAVLINGRKKGTTLTFEHGKTYRLRISNVGLQNSLNFHIQGHKMKLVEVEGTHTVQTYYSSLDIHAGQSYSVLVTANRKPRSYYIAVSTRFSERVLTSTAILHYRNSESKRLGGIPHAPTTTIAWSMNQARSIRTNLTASGPRPNPQGSFRYGQIKISRTIILKSSSGLVHGKQRYGVNGVSFIPADTPLKLADQFNIKGVFRVGTIPDKPESSKNLRLATAVMGADYHDFLEIVFQNREKILQTWHIDGYSFFVVGMDQGKWTPTSRNGYNLIDAVPRSTVQVYPRSWTAIYISLDNVGMWNIRTENWARQYLGEQFYLRVYTSSKSTRDELPIPKNALLCGKAKLINNISA